MEEPTQDQSPLEDQPDQETPPTESEGETLPNGETSGVEPPAKLPETKLQRILKFAAGFFGWFLVSFIVFGTKMDSNGLELSLGVMFIANIFILIYLLKKRSFIGWGMLSAVAVNLVVSLILGVFVNALCFIPFYNKF